MKTLLLVAIFCSHIMLSFSQTGNVGIGTSSPKALLHIADSNVLFNGPTTIPASTIYNPPASGIGSRMMWYPQKGAFRVGFVQSSQWDRDNIGTHSFAAGHSTSAKGNVSTSFGLLTTASGFAATSMGDFTTASGFYSTSMGSDTRASGDGSTSMGADTWASGFASTSMGDYTLASGYTSTSMGLETVASGFASTSMGELTKAKSDYSLVIGRCNDTSNTSSLFEIGNGSFTSRNNAMTVLSNGNIGFGTANPLAYGHGGTNRILELRNTIANGENIQSHVILSSNGSSGALGGLTWASRSIPGEQRTGFIGNVFETASQTKLTFFARNSIGVLGEKFNVQGNGNAWLQGTLTQSSDARLKKDIEPIAGALQNLKKLHGYTYKWRDDSADSSTQIGLLAQELQKIYPQLVKENSKGELSVNYMGIIPLLIESIKELKLENDQQKKRIEALEQSQLK